jgi:hypothetical protein
MSLHAQSLPSFLLVSTRPPNANAAILSEALESILSASTNFLAQLSNVSFFSPEKFMQVTWPMFVSLVRG